MIHLNSPDAWFLMTGIAPSQVASTFLSRVRVNGANAVLDAQCARGAIRAGRGGDSAWRRTFAPLEVFEGRHFTGPSRRLAQLCRLQRWRNLGTAGYERSVPSSSSAATWRRSRSRKTARASAAITSRRMAISKSRRLPRGARKQRSLRPHLPVALDEQEGLAGNIEAGLNVDWHYNWNIDRNSTLDWEYVAIRRHRGGRASTRTGRARGANHVARLQRADRPDQANMTVGRCDLRVAGPAGHRTARRRARRCPTADCSWLYDFIDAGGCRRSARRFRAGALLPLLRQHRRSGRRRRTSSTISSKASTTWRSARSGSPSGTTARTGPTTPIRRSRSSEAAIAAMIEMLDNTPFVERYAHLQLGRGRAPREVGRRLAHRRGRDLSRPDLAARLPPGNGRPRHRIFGALSVRRRRARCVGQRAGRDAAPARRFSPRENTARRSRSTATPIICSSHRGSATARTSPSPAGFIGTAAATGSAFSISAMAPSHHLVLTPKSGGNTLRFRHHGWRQRAAAQRRPRCPRACGRTWP